VDFDLIEGGSLTDPSAEPSFVNLRDTQPLRLAADPVVVDATDAPPVDRAPSMKVATEIDEDTCLGLLGGITFGRVALSVRALPRIVPVRLAVDRGRISIHMQGAADVGNGLDDAVVALQADGYDDDTHQAWSVHVVGPVIDRCESGFAIDPSVIKGEWMPR